MDKDYKDLKMEVREWDLPELRGWHSITLVFLVVHLLQHQEDLFLYGLISYQTIPTETYIHLYGIENFFIFPSIFQ